MISCLTKIKIVLGTLNDKLSDVNKDTDGGANDKLSDVNRNSNERTK